MQEFLYHIIDPTTGLYYYVDTVSKQVLTTIDPVFLQYTPDGWEKKSIAFIRSNENYGVLKSFTIPLQFVGDGARILRNLLYTKIGMETLADLSIKKLNPATGQHLRYYRGELNLVEFEDELDSVSVNVIEGRIAKLLKANKSTKYEFDLDTIAETKRVLMDGLELDNIYHYTNVNISFKRTTGTNLWVPISFINKEGDNYGILAQSTQIKDVEAPSIDKDNYFLKTTTKAITIALKGTVTFQSDIAGQVSLFVFLHDGSNSALYTTRVKVYENLANTPGFINSYTFDGTTLGSSVFTLPQGWAVYLSVFCPGVEPTITYTNEPLDVSFIYKFEPTYIKSIPAYILGKLLIEKICGIGYNFVSALLTNRPDIVISSGDAIRGITAPKIKTSWDEFFKAMDSLLMIGMSYDGDTALLENRDYFYDNTTEIFNVGDVESASLSQAKELVFNTIKIGYPSQQTKFDDINGRYEFNTTHQYTTPVTRITKPYEQISPYRADMYGIEVIRINLDAKKNTSNDSDNDVFLLNAEDYSPTVTFSFNAGNTFLVADETPISPTDVITISGTSLNNGIKHVVSVTPFVGTSGTISLLVTISEPTFSELLVTGTITNNYKKLYRKTYDSITGLPYPLSAFNIEFSPKRMLLNHGKWISSIMYRLESKEIVFQTTDKNPDLLTVKGTTVIKEKGNKTIGDLAPRFFKPYIFKITTSTPINLVELAGANSRGYVSFRWNGITYRGFIMNIEIQPATLEKKEFELLCCPDVDLTTYNNF